MLQLRFIAHQRQQRLTARQRGVVFHDICSVDRQLEMPLQRFGQRQRFAINRYRFIALQPQQFNQLFDQRGIVLIPHAQRVAGLIAQTGIAEIDFDMAHIF